MRPAYCTALGKIILPGFTPQQLDRYLSETKLLQLTSSTISDPNLLREEVEKVRMEGVAYDRGEFDEELRCLAMPVRNFTGQIMGAVGISTPIWRTQSTKAQRVRYVSEAAARLSREFGSKE